MFYKELAYLKSEFIGKRENENITMADFTKEQKLNTIQTTEIIKQIEKENSK